MQEVTAADVKKTARILRRRGMDEDEIVRDIASEFDIEEASLAEYIKED